MDANRICGAPVERTARQAAQCWCAGLFCGKGGYVRSRAFRMDFPRVRVLLSRAQFEEVALQLDLFDQDQVAEKWRARLAEYRITHPAPVPVKRHAAAS